MPLNNHLHPLDPINGTVPARDFHNTLDVLKRDSGTNDVDNDDGDPDLFYRSFRPASTFPDSTTPRQQAVSPSNEHVQELVTTKSPVPTTSGSSIPTSIQTLGDERRPRSRSREPKGVIGERIRAFDHYGSTAPIKSPDHLSKTTRRTSDAPRVGLRPAHPDSAHRTHSPAMLSAGHRRLSTEEPKHLQLLFGEVVNSRTEQQTPGYGITGFGGHQLLNQSATEDHNVLQPRDVSQRMAPSANASWHVDESPSTGGGGEEDIVQRVENLRPPSRSPNRQLNLADEMILSSRRYDPRKATEPSHAVNAVVVAPNSKSSPALRSSRPRQPVTTATTAASRARIANRFARPEELEQQRANGQASKSRVPPSIPGGVDVAARRAKWQDKSIADEARSRGPAKEKKLGNKSSVGGNIRPRPDVDSRGGLTDPSDPARSGKHNDTATEATSELLNMTGIMNSSTAIAASPETTLSAPNLSSDTLQNRDVDVMTNSKENSEGLGREFFNHVLRLRPGSQADDTKTKAIEDFLSEKDDGETIQILLGSTPVLPSWSEDSEDDMNVSHQHEDCSDLHEGTESVFGGTPSLGPDDSISVVFANKGRNARAKDELSPSAHARFMEMMRVGELKRPSSYQNAASVAVPEPEPEPSNYPSNVLQTPVKEGPTEADSTPSPRRPLVSSISHPILSPSGRILSPDINDDDLSNTNTNSSPYAKYLQFHTHSTSDATLGSMRSDSTIRARTLDSRDVPPALPPKDFHFPPPSVPWKPQVALRYNQVSSEQSSGLPPKQLYAKSGTSSTKSFDPSDPFSEAFPTLHHGSMQDETAISRRDTIPALDDDNIAVNAPLQQVGFDAEASILRKSSGEIEAGDDTRFPSWEDPSTVSEQHHSPSFKASKPQGLEKSLNERRNYIKELVDTEHSYSQDMTIMEDIYAGTASTVLCAEDRRILFGNLSALRTFSVEFLDALRQSAAPVYLIPRENRWNYKRGSYGTSSSANTDQSSSTLNTANEKERISSDSKTTIGQTFLAFLDQIEKIYGDWIVKTNDAANTRLKELQQKPTINMWLEECHASAKDITQAWSLDALIIKPAQRLMKYPLLLSAIIKHTNQDHPEYELLKQANESILMVISRVNEAKKRADLVDQAMNRRRKDSDAKLKVAKLLNRRTEKLKQHVGLAVVADDQDYEVVAQKFGGHFFQLQVVMRDIEKYLEDCQSSIAWLNMFLRALVDYTQLDRQERWPEIESSWIRFAQAVQETQDVALTDHLAKVRQHAIEPIVTLWKLHEGPQRMMNKRKKRLVDHVRYKTLIQRGEKPDKKMQTEEDEYNAVNEVLKEELPKLYTLTKKLVEACLANFVDLQAEWQSVLQKKLGPFGDRQSTEFMDVGAFAQRLQSTFNQDFIEWDSRIKSLSLCNGTTLAEVQKLLAAVATPVVDDQRPSNRPRLSTFGSSQRTFGFGGDRTPGGTATSKSDKQDGHTPVASSSSSFRLARPGSTMQDEQHLHSQNPSAFSSRGPSTPRTLSAQFAQHAQFNTSSPAEVESYLQKFATTPGTTQDSRSSFNSDHQMPSTFADTRHFGWSGSVRNERNERNAAEERFSGIFNSALPMSDSPPANSPLSSVDDAKVLFLAASLFEFNIDGSRREGGYPYLRYVPGEIFDVIAQKGELWLAKNQDDPSKLVGWIWEKHFARILPDDP